MNMNFSGFDDTKLQELGALNTAKEIAGQPQLWLDTWMYLDKVRNELNEFLNSVLRKKNLRIIFTGCRRRRVLGDIQKHEN